MSSLHFKGPTHSAALTPSPEQSRKGRLTKWPGPTKWPRRISPPTCARVGSRSVARTPYVRRTYSVRAAHQLRVRAAHVASHVRARRLAVRARAPRCALPPSHVRLDSVRSSAMGAPLDLPGRPGTFLQSIEEYADSIHGRATAIAPISLTAPAAEYLKHQTLPSVCSAWCIEQSVFGTLEFFHIVCSFGALSPPRRPRILFPTP